MKRHYQDLGIYSDWVDEACRQQELFPVAAPGPETQQRVKEVLGFCKGPEIPMDVRVETTWEKDGIQGEEVSWSVGYGPRTHAFVLKPAGTSRPLPGILALHDHGGFKYYGKEKIADGPQETPEVIRKFRDGCYSGRAYANELAKEGFVVVVHDTFLWGSRRFPTEVMKSSVDTARAVLKAREDISDTPVEVEEYNLATGFHEHMVAKYCNLLGTSLAGVVSHEDRIAFNYLLSRPDVKAEKAGCLGLSGGGNRTALLQATHQGVSAAVIVGLMSTYAGLLDHNVNHTWMLYPYGWSRYGDWPDLAACRAPSPLLVQYDLQDELFTEEGMRAAHARIQAHYASVNHPKGYTGQFYPGPHKFDLEMQQAAFRWLKEQLNS